jgi:hypothetical protein
MMRKLEILALVVSCCLGASAAIDPGTISGTVHDSAGTPAPGAVVEVLAAPAARSESAVTNNKGSFTVQGLLPGLYTVKVTAPNFLPTIREQVRLQPGANLLLNITLNTLFEAIQLVPKHRDSSSEDDDWRWALRSMANRPILRLADDKPLVVVQKSDANEGQLKARVSFLAGSDDAFSSSGMDTNFQVEQSMFGKKSLTPEHWSLNGGMESNTANPSAVLRAAYSRQMPDGSTPEIALSARHFASLNPNQPAIQALALSIANAMTFGEYLELDYGGETQMLQFRDPATSFRPFATVTTHPGKNTILQYRYATSAPNLRRAKGFDTAPADLSESDPHVTISARGQQVERDLHHELSLSQRIGKNKFQIAAFSDTVHNAAVTGAGATFTQDTNALIVDPFSGNFYFNGGNLHSTGLRAVYSHPIGGGLDATADYSFGKVLTAPESLVQLGPSGDQLVTAKRQSVAGKLSGTVHGSKTHVIASYRWLSGSSLTPVDAFNASAGETDPYLSFFIRQPIPSMHLLPNGLEALIDVRNLLAQGYRPVLSADGSTVYLVQGTRVIRAGLSFNF